MTLKPAELHPWERPSVAAFELLEDIVRVEETGANAAIVDLRGYELAADLAVLEEAGLIRASVRPDGQVGLECCSGC